MNFSGKNLLYRAEKCQTYVIFGNKTLPFSLDHRTKKTEHLKKITNNMLEMMFQVLKCFFNFLSTMIFHRVLVVWK